MWTSLNANTFGLTLHHAIHMLKQVFLCLHMLDSTKRVVCFAWAPSSVFLVDCYICKFACDDNGLFAYATDACCGDMQDDDILAWPGKLNVSFDVKPFGYSDLLGMKEPRLIQQVKVG